MSEGLPKNCGIVRHFFQMTGDSRYVVAQIDQVAKMNTVIFQYLIIHTCKRIVKMKNIPLDAQIYEYISFCCVDLGSYSCVYAKIIFCLMIDMGIYAVKINI